MATSGPPDDPSSVSLAQAKLARQTKRIREAEAALSAPALAERQATRGKGKIWKPFDFTADATYTGPSNDARMPLTETRVTSFRAQTRESSLSRSMSSLSQRTTGTVPSDMDRQDSAPTDGTGFQLYTGRKGRRNADQLSAYEDKPEEKQTTVEATFDPRMIYEVFGNALPAPEFMEQNLGHRDGQLQFIQHPNGDVSAHQWSQSRYIWENIGQFSNIRKKIEGQLAADCLKGETAYQTLQQNTLGYFRTVAKQREAHVMGLPFGAKEIQTLMPNIRPAQAVPSPKKTVSAADTLEPPPENLIIKHDDTVSSTTGSSSQVGIDQQVPYEGYPAYAAYGGYAGYGGQRYHYGHPYHVPTGPRAERYSAYGYGAQAAYQDPFYTPDSNRDACAGLAPTLAGYPGRHNAYGLLGAMAEKPQSMNYDYHFPPPGADARHAQTSTAAQKDTKRMNHAATRPNLSIERRSFSHLSSNEPAGSASTSLTNNRVFGDSAVTSSRPKPVTPLSSRTAMREHLIKLGDQAKERSLSQANIRTVLYDPFRNQSSVPGEQSDKAEPAKLASPELKRTVANPSGLPAHLQPPASQTTPSHKFNSAVGAPPLTSAASVEILKNSSPDTYWSKRATDVSTPCVPATSQSQDKPTPQSFKGPFFGDYPGLPGSAAKKASPLSMKTYDQKLKDWWMNGNTFARQQEFYERVKASHKDADLLDSSSPASLPPIGTPAKKPATSIDDPMTRLLIPVLENLASYVQGPVEKRRDYFSQWTQPPEWCIDRSPSGNNSFFDSEWGQPPARVGRDPRYRPLPVESVRFGGFSSPQGVSNLAVGGGLDRRFGFGGGRN